VSTTTTHDVDTIAINTATARQGIRCQPTAATPTWCLAGSPGPASIWAMSRPSCSATDLRGHLTIVNNTLIRRYRALKGRESEHGD
jgi:hypothetical protein